MAYNQMLVGTQTNTDGTIGIARAGRLGDAIVSGLHGKYYEQAYRGTSFFIDSDSVTTVSANTTKTNATSAVLINGFFNPYGSGKNAVITFAHAAFVSGTSTGPLVWNAQALPPGVSLTNTATGTIRGTYISYSPPQTSAMLAQVGVAIVRSDAKTTAFTQLGVFGGVGAAAVTGAVSSITEDVGGRIIIPPGTVFGLSQIGQSTTLVVQTTIAWEEVPV
jgi:hypothetical protein